MAKYHNILILISIMIIVLCLAMIISCEKKKTWQYVPFEKRPRIKGFDVNVSFFSVHQTKQIVKEINSMNLGWKAKKNFPDDTPKEYLKRIANGTLKETNETKLPLKSKIPGYDRFSELVAIPKQYDARLKYPNCPIIGLIRHQGSCNSCWGITTSEVFSDRLCIHSKGKYNIELSALDTVTCTDPSVSNGCDFGRVSKALNFLVSKGVVTGGAYGTKKTCKPYHCPPETGRPCYTKGCIENCTVSTYNKSYFDDKYFAATGYSLPSFDEDEIKKEILMNGPVIVQLEVYSDFLYNYHSGVYERHTDRLEGFHGAKLIGWGEDDDGKPYWIGANSWGTNWGEKGFFKIIRGFSECGVEEVTQTLIPKIPAEVKKSSRVKH